MASFKSTSLMISTLFLFHQFCMIKGHYQDEGIPADLDDGHLKLVKVWCLIIIFFATFGSGLLPYFFRFSANFLVLGTQFAGGVFLAISMHYLSDASDVTDDYTEGSSFLPFLLVLVGYILTIFVESILLSIKNKGGERADMLEEGRKSEISESANDAGVDQPNPVLARRAAVEVAIILVIGLALHSVFEGITIGLAERDRYAWRYLWTISIHKVFLGIALGIVVLRMQPKRPFLTTAVYSFAFAISTPVGIIIAFAIKESAQNGAADWIYALSMGVTCGAFLHVSLYHLLPKGFKSPQSQTTSDTPFRRFFAIFVGVLGIVIGMIFN